MKICINNNDAEIENGTTIEDIIKTTALNKWVSVWVNGSQLLESEYPTYIVKENDEIKIIRILAGG
jgi:sulfur carrier protein